MAVTQARLKWFVGAICPLLAALLTAVAARSFHQSPAVPQAQSLAGHDCRVLIHFEPTQLAVTPTQASMIQDVARIARATKHAIYFAYSSTNADPDIAKQARQASLMQSVRSLRAQGFTVRASESADVYFNSDVYVDACAP